MTIKTPRRSKECIVLLGMKEVRYLTKKKQFAALLLTLLLIFSVFSTGVFADPPIKASNLPLSCTLAMRTVTNSWHWFHYGLECMVDLMFEGELIHY